MNREYLQITPTGAPLDPAVVTTTLSSLYKLRDAGAPGLIPSLKPARSTTPSVFEFIAMSEGRAAPVQFYYGTQTRLGVLEQRLRSMYPASFDIERVRVDPLEKLGISDDPDQDNDGVVPDGVCWRGRAERRKDWMTTLTGFSQVCERGPYNPDEDSFRSGRSPLAPMVDLLTKAETPMAFQVLFRRKPDWSRQAKRRAGALLAGRDTLVQQLLSIESPGPRGLSNGPARRNRRDLGGGPNGNDSIDISTWTRDHERDHERVTRLDLLRANTPKRTFTVNARLLSLIPNGVEDEEIGTYLYDLCAVFDPIDGPYYGIDGERFRSMRWLTGDGTRYAKAELDRFRARSIRTRRRDRFPRITNRSDYRPDLVLNADELANLVTVPSASDLTVEGVRGSRAEQRSRKPLPRPDHDITSKLRRPGLDIGCLLDENRIPDEEPVRISPDLLPFHVGRFAKTGAGKSVALINDALSLYEHTTGPVFIIDTKGGGLPEHYMRAHAKRFGFRDLEANVLHFDIPEILPGFAFFNIEPSIANGVPRLQAVKDRVDHYEEVLKMTMGAERYEQAVVSPNLLKYLIRLMYDEKYGLEHGLYRESVNYFGQSQLEQVVDQLYSAGPPQADPDEAPRSSTEEVSSKIHRHLTADPRTFANILGGVSHRMDYITADPFLRQIFDSTTPRSTFATSSI